MMPAGDDIVEKPDDVVVIGEVARRDHVSFIGEAQDLVCVVFFLEAVRAAVKDYYDKNGIAYDPEMFKESDDPHELSCDT